MLKIFFVSFQDGIIDQLYELFMDHFYIHAHKIGFPELVLPAIIQVIITLIIEETKKNYKNSLKISNG